MYPLLLDKIFTHSPDSIKIASIVKAELLYGAEKSRRKDENLDKINRFLLPYEIVPFDDKAAVRYSGIRAELEKIGAVIGPNDLIIAATVLAGDGILITNNEREFQRFGGLVIENWVQLQ